MKWNCTIEDVVQEGKYKLLQNESMSHFEKKIYQFSKKLKYFWRDKQIITKTSFQQASSLIRTTDKS